MNKKIKKVLAALSLCAAMAATSLGSFGVAQAAAQPPIQSQGQPPIHTPVAPQPLSLNAQTVEIEQGGKYQLFVKGENNAENAAWSSSNEYVAKVTQAGRVESLRTGTTTITASLNGRTGSCTVTVVSTGTIGNLFYGLWQSEYYPLGVYLSANDMASPMNNLLRKDISVKKFKGYSFVRVAAYTKVNGTPRIHVQAKKGGKRMSVFLSLHSEGDRQVLNFEYAKGSNPASGSGQYFQTYYAYRPTK